jgi:hypothetical protein
VLILGLLVVLMQSVDGSALVCRRIELDPRSAVALLDPADCTSCVGTLKQLVARHVAAVEDVKILLRREPTPFERKQLVLAHVRPSGVLRLYERVLLDNDTTLSCRAELPQE